MKRYSLLFNDLLFIFLISFLILVKIFFLEKSYAETTTVSIFTNTNKTENNNKVENKNKIESNNKTEKKKTKTEEDKKENKEKHNHNTESEEIIGTLNDKFIKKTGEVGKETTYITINDDRKTKILAKYQEKVINLRIVEQPLKIFIDVLFAVGGKYEIIDKEILDEIITGEIIGLNITDTLEKLLFPYHIYYNIIYDAKENDIIYQLYRYKETYISFNNMKEAEQIVKNLKENIVSQKGTIIVSENKNIIYVKDYQKNIEIINKIYNK